MDVVCFSSVFVFCVEFCVVKFVSLVKRCVVVLDDVVVVDIKFVGKVVGFWDVKFVGIKVYGVGCFLLFDI